MKYRIVETNGRFSPQWRHWWWPFWTRAWHEDFDCGGWPVFFPTLASTQEVIDSWKRQDAPQIHPIP